MPIEKIARVGAAAFKVSVRRQGFPSVFKTFDRNAKAICSSLYFDFFTSSSPVVEDPRRQLSPDLRSRGYTVPLSRASACSRQPSLFQRPASTYVGPNRKLST
jgi:hypothetical protein